MSTVLLSVREAAKRLAVHPKTIRALIHTGQLKVVRPLGTIFRIPEEELERWVQAQIYGDRKR